MTVGNADILQAIYTIWNDNLDGTFKSYWSDADQDEFLSLEEEQAAPSQPFPYCVLSLMPGNTKTRMSRRNEDETRRWEEREVMVKFVVHAKETDGVSKTAKKFANDLAEEVMKFFGGHPTQAPAAMSLSNGGVMLTQYQNDFGVRTGDDEHSWVLQYLFKVDVPVAA